MADSHIGSHRFIGLSTDDKRAMLRRAWNNAADSANSLLPQLEIEAQKIREILEQDVSSSASNSHSATAFMPGTNKPTATEDLRGWNQIIEGFYRTRQYLRDCANYGVDAFTTFINGYFPAPLPTIVNPAIIIDPTGRWLRLTSFWDVDSTLVVGQPVGDESIYCWLLDHSDTLLNIESGARESRGDYSMGIIGRGGMQFT